MRRALSWQSVLVGGLVALAAFACTGERGDIRATGVDERVTVTREPLAATEGAVLLGRVAPGERTTPSARRLLVIVNGTPQVVPLAPDGSFQVRDVPTGELTFKAELDDVPGVVVIDEVDDGELLEISITPARDNLAIALTRRAAPAATPVRRGLRLEARGKDVVYRLGPGVHEGSMTVIGDGITVLGAHEGEACDDAHRTVLLGDLVIEGEGNVVDDVAVRGEVIAKGKGVRVFDSCSGAYFDDATTNGGLTGWRRAGARSGPRGRRVTPCLARGAARVPCYATSRAEGRAGEACARDPFSPTLCRGAAADDG